MKRLVRDLTSFFFPPLCLHCRKLLSQTSPLFCLSCLPFFELLDPEKRCTRCFKEVGIRGVCVPCRQERNTNIEIGSAFEYQGPLVSFIKHLKRRNAPYLAKTAAAWLILQFEKLQWPLPDSIIPVPSPWIRRISQGKDHAALIAEEFSHFLGIPVIQPLCRKSGEPSQGKRNSEERPFLNAESFILKRPSAVLDQTLLIIDDQIHTGATLHSMALALKRGCPRKIYALTLCKSSKEL